MKDRSIELKDRDRLLFRAKCQRCGNEVDISNLYEEDSVNVRAVIGPCVHCLANERQIGSLSVEVKGS